MSREFELDEVRKMAILFDNMDVTGDFERSSCCAVVGTEV